MVKQLKEKALQYGFTLDENLMELNRIFFYKCLSIYIEVYIDSPYALLCKTKKEKVEVVQDNDRIIILNKAKKETLTNIPKKDIDCCLIKEYTNGCHEVIMAIRGIRYKMVITWKMWLLNWEYILTFKLVYDRISFNMNTL